jgi:peroxiredoxin
MPALKKLITIILLTYLPCFSFAKEKAKRYEINGVLNGFSENTYIYLDIETLSGKSTDSTMIVNNKFSFIGVLKEDAVQVIVHTAKFEDYKFFWLENKVISFRAEKGHFRSAVITGSRTQKLDAALELAIEKSGKEKEENINFINAYPASIISISLLDGYGATWGKDITAKLYKNVSKDLKKTAYGKHIEEFLLLNKNLKVGDPAVNFSQKDTSGATINLFDFKGKVVLLEFWGSWCFPCRNGNPALVKTYSDFKDKGFEILGVAAESSKEDWLNAVKQDGLHWPNVSDLKGDNNQAALIYGVSYYPCNYLIDRSGKLIAKDLRGDELVKKLRSLLL